MPERPGHGPRRDLYRRAHDLLMLADPHRKSIGARRLYRDWRRGDTRGGAAPAPVRVPAPGRPPRPRLVAQPALPRRGVGSLRGRRVLAHALAHIEFNAINLALDAVYRFRDLPATYYGDWLRVASEEALHFRLLCRYLSARGGAYGDHDAHDGLWQAAWRTDHDAAARMALVPRVLEARGLDVTPGLIVKLRAAGDGPLAAVLGRIYRDEIEHVRIGSHWFRFLCARRGVDPRREFRALVRRHFDGRLRGPFNDDARLAAGFTAPELSDLRALGG